MKDSGNSLLFNIYSLLWVLRRTLYGCLFFQWIKDNVVDMNSFNEIGCARRIKKTQSKRDEHFSFIIEEIIV